MCAISGIVNFHPADLVNPCTLARMTDSMSHRGPDDRGQFLDGNVGLGHRRLSIIDLAGGKQPMCTEDGSVVVVFNGEIYNFEELKAELVARGHSFKTNSDTETIGHAYEEYGDLCVERFRGMFAFAVWDRIRRRLLLARDRLGVKPVYFYESARFLTFASEIKALFEVEGVPREVDLDALSFYTTLRYVPGPRTMFRNIFKLQPGHILIRDGNETHIRKYWDIEFQPSECGPEQLSRQLDQLLDESVRLRLIADVPLGLFLSGGLDSTSILSVMSRQRKARGIHTFSIGYEQIAGRESECNEFSFARMAAETFHTRHTEYRIGARAVEDVLPDLVWHLDEPLADPTCVPLYYLSKVAREHITVVLSGEGADEVLGGYGIYRTMLRIEAARRYFGRLPSVLSMLLKRFAPGERQRAALDSIGMPLEARYRGVSRGFFPETRRRLLPWAEERRSDDQLDMLFESCFRAAKPASQLDRMLYVDTRIWLPDDLLQKADKMTMANALELRVPFLDHRLVDFAATLPSSAKLNGGVGKALLRRVMSHNVPAPILKREKRGFPIPIRHWLRTDLRNLVRDALLSPGSAVNNYMDVDVIQGLIDEHEKGRTNREQEIWSLLIFELWHRAFIDGGASCNAGSPVQAASMEAE